MAMTPDEIRAKSFSTVKKGGLDGDDVSTFLVEVAEEVAELHIQLESAKSEAVAASVAQPPPEPSQSAAVIGPRVDEVLAAAQRSADGIVRDAEEWATQHKAEADEYAMGLREQVDELRATTEKQAESFRTETVEYANTIRSDAESAAAAIREAADADVSAQYETISVEAATRWNALQAAESEILATLDSAVADVSRTQSAFREVVDAHSEAIVEAGVASVEDTPAAPTEPVPEIGEPVGFADSSAPVAQEQSSWEADTGSTDAGAQTWGTAESTDASETPAEMQESEDAVGWGDPSEETAATDARGETNPEAPAAIDVSGGSPDPVVEGAAAVDTAAPVEAQGWTNGSEDADEGTSVDSTSVDSTSVDSTSVDSTSVDSTSGDSTADEAAVTMASWGEAPEEPAEATEPAGWETSTEPADTDTWATETDGWGSAPEGGDSWGTAPSTDPWATETTAGVATAAEADSSFFEEAAPAQEGSEGDPLASMVRDAVERVTEGDGAN